MPSIILDANVDNVNSKTCMEEIEGLRLTAEDSNKTSSTITTKYSEEVLSQDRKRKHSTKDHHHHRRGHHHRHHYNNDCDKYSKKKSKTHESVQLTNSTDPLPISNDNITDNNDVNIIHDKGNNNSSDIIDKKNKAINSKNKRRQDKKLEKVHNMDISVADSTLMMPVVKIKRNLSSSGSLPLINDPAKKQKLSQKEVPGSTMDETTSSGILRQGHLSVHKNKDDSVGEASIVPTMSTTSTEKQTAVEHKTTSKKKGAHRKELTSNSKSDNLTANVLDSTQTCKNHLITPTKVSKKGSSTSYIKSNNDHSISKKERCLNSPTPRENLQGILRCLQRDEKIILLKKLPCFDKTDKTHENKIKASSSSTCLSTKDLKTEKNDLPMSTSLSSASSSCKKKTTHNKSSSHSKHGHSHSHRRSYSSSRGHSAQSSYETANPKVKHTTVSSNPGQLKLNKNDSSIGINENDKNEEEYTSALVPAAATSPAEAGTIVTAAVTTSTSTFSMATVNDKCISNNQEIISDSQVISGNNKECYNTKKQSRQNSCH